MFCAHVGEYAMAYSQHDLARRFKNGETTGTASNMKIVELRDGSTALVGYGHAVYALRKPDGHITVYAGWYMRNASRWAGSQSTKSQFSQFRSIGDKTVAYSSASTSAERQMQDQADVVTSNTTACAPKLRQVHKEAKERAEELKASA